MNLYYCMIDLRQAAKALTFSIAVDAWMAHLKEAGKINHWRMLRRKLNLASENHSDFLLEIEVCDLAQLDLAFRESGRQDEDVARLHRAVHDLIGQSSVGLYRSYLDLERSERMALI